MRGRGGAHAADHTAVSRRRCPVGLRSLQDALGNRGVAALVQRKPLPGGRSGGAEDGSRRSPPTGESAATTSCGGCAGEAEPCQDCARAPARQRAGESTGGRGSAAQEWEADRIVDRILGTAADLRGPGPAGPAPLSQAGRPKPGGSPAVPAHVGRVMTLPGRPLDGDARSFMERRFGFDFGRVRIHDDAVAAASARSLGALAYTVGSEVVFAPGRYAPRTEPGRRLLAHELTHVVQQTGPGASGRVAISAVDEIGIQGKYVEEPAAGCGVCKSSTAVGAQVHRLVQTGAFPREVQSEEGIENPLDEENGRLDLIEIVHDETHATVFISFGEIKPYNTNGVKRGVRDLAFYERAIRHWAEEVFPGARQHVEGLDVEPTPATLQFLETEGCPLQRVEIERARGEPQGLYLYSCDPPRSQLPKHCCEEEDGEEDREGRERADEILDQPPLFFDWLGDAGKTAQPKSGDRTAEPPGETVETPPKAAYVLLLLAAAARYGGPAAIELLRQTAAAMAPQTLAAATAGAGGSGLLGTGGVSITSSGGGAAAGGSQSARLLSLGTRAGILGAAATVTVLVFGAIAKHFFSEIYEGTRGWKLLAFYERLGVLAERLGHESGAADELIGLLVSATDPDSDEWAGVRSYLFEVLYTLRVSAYRTATELETSARQFSAIREQLEEGPGERFRLEMTHEIADEIIARGGDSYTDLMMLHMQLGDLVSSLEGKMTRLVDRHREVLRADIRNWLARRK